MSIENAFQGSLFANDFLEESITRLVEWEAIDDAALDAFREQARSVFDRFPVAQTPNESPTEDDLILPRSGALRRRHQLLTESMVNEILSRGSFG